MTTENKKNATWAIHLAVMIALMFGFRFIPAPSPITSYGMSVLGIFLGMIYG